MSYRFLPWVRQGLASEISTVDDLTSPLPGRSSVTIRVKLSNGSEAGNDVALNGPGDVIGLDPRSVIRVDPPRSGTRANPDQFAAIEFDNPDLPWMFTPAAAGDRGRLRPWLVLVTVEVQEGVSVETGQGLLLPLLRIETPAVPAWELPDLRESWAWAHSQITGAGTDPGSLPDHLADHPDRNVSRILCPRRLEPDRTYLACLVPAFEAGRLAGLGQPADADTVTGPAWAAPDLLGSSVTLPIYHHWTFSTGASGDFESLCRRLVPRPAQGSVGGRSMFVGDAHRALPPVPAGDGGILTLTGALRSPSDDDGAIPLPADYLSALVDLVNGPADQVVDGAGDDDEPLSPPLYGGPNARVERLDGLEPVWLGELNRDPRLRVAAGLGAEVVRRNQEEFVDAAWAQVGEAVKAARAVERARFLSQVADRVRRRHVLRLRDDVALGFSGPVHAVITDGEQSLKTTVEKSFLPDATIGTAFRRLASPRSRLLKRAIRQATARRAAALADPATPSVSALAVGSAISRLAVGALRLLERPVLANPANPNPAPEPVATPGGEPVVLGVVAARDAVVAAVDPLPVAGVRAALAVRIGGRSLIQVLTDALGGAGDGMAGFQAIFQSHADVVPLLINDVTGGPDLSVSLFPRLLSLSPDHILAGSGSIPDDTVTLLQPDSRFVEAFLVGANHEMNRELLWRRYPTTRRGTPFRRFWDRSDGLDDLPALGSVPHGAHLGQLAGSESTGLMTLLVRGQLLRRFPDTVIYAVPARPDGTISADPAAAVNPILWGNLGDDLVYVGFALSRDEVEAGDGWCFVLAEQPAASRFGLDTPGPGTGTLDTWSDLTWAHVGVEPGGHLDLTASGLADEDQPLSLPLAPGSGAAVFGRNSAHLAAITLQRPFRAVLHSSDLLAGVDRPVEEQEPPVLHNANLLRPTGQGAQR